MVMARFRKRSELDRHKCKSESATSEARVWEGFVNKPRLNLLFFFFFLNHSASYAYDLFNYTLGIEIHK